MKKYLAIVLVSGVWLTLPASAYAQALAEARARLACGKDTIVDAVYLPGDILRVTCSENSEKSSGQEESLLNNGEPFTVAPPLVALGAVGLLAILFSGGSSSSTTSTGFSPAE